LCVNVCVNAFSIVSYIQRFDPIDQSVDLPVSYAEHVTSLY